MSRQTECSQSAASAMTQYRKDSKMVEAALISTATAAAKAMAQLVASRALDESKLGWGFTGELEKLKQKFKYIQAFLEDASDSKYATKSQVDLWVQKVKNAAYMADNVIDEYAIEIFRRKMELKKPMDRFHNFFTPYNPVLFNISMAHKVKEILSLFDEIDKVANDIGLKPVDIAATSVTHTSRFDNDLSQTREHPFTSASEFVGREKDQSELLDFMCNQLNEDCLLSTVAIVGMGGMGKTTLARHLYDRERVGDHFGKKIWLCVSEDFDVIKLLNKMIESLTSKQLGLSSPEAIIRELKELNGKKLLLVLDDVWNQNERLWGSLEWYLRKTSIASGSVILTTTRSLEVAQAAGTVFNLKLEGLSNDDSWSLLHQTVFGHSTRQCFSHLEEAGKRIAVKKCKGVPLAIKVIGGLLKSKADHEWPKIESSEIWDLPQGQHQILPSLLLSFNHLPFPSLKQCFANCGLLFKGAYMCKSELIGFWLSQGYLHDKGSRNITTMEIGEEYVNILLSNSLLKAFVPEGRENVYYMMHDLIIDLSVFVCGKDLILDAKELRESGGRCRHLLYRCVENTIKTDFPPVQALIGLRTILFMGPSVPLQLLIHTRDLRTLCLDRTSISEVPQVISELKHLRYLDLSYNPISTLPEFIGKLYQLQTLILQGCRNMKKLPKVVNQLVNLRHVSTTAPMFACKGLQKLTNLQTLPCLSLNNDEEGWKIDELGHLRDLRDEIHIQGLECVKDKEQAERADIAGKTNVLNLTLRWVVGREKYLAGFPEEFQDLIDQVPAWVSYMLGQEADLAGKHDAMELIMCWVKGMEENGGDNCDNDFAHDLSYLQETSVELLNFIDELPSWMSWMLVQFENLAGHKSSQETNETEKGICHEYVLDCFEPQIHVTTAEMHHVIFDFFKWCIDICHQRDYRMKIDVTSDESKCFINQFLTKMKKMVNLKSSLDVKYIGAGETLRWSEVSDSFSDGDILGGLEPHPNITSLEVHNFMGLQFPAWIKEMVVLTGGLSNTQVQLNNLTKIKLLGCNRCQTLPKLGQLPSLKCLIMSGLCVNSIGMEFYGGDMLEVVSFKCLKEFEISGFSRLTTWMQPPKAAFPNLETLRIKDCSLLKSVPALETESLMTLELKKLYSMVSLDIIRCSLGLTSFIMETLPGIVSLPQELANCTKLQILRVRNCHKLSRMPSGLESLVCLKSLIVSNCAVINFVMDDLRPVRSSIRCLQISKCPRFRKIPNGLEECSLLESLKLHMCPMIEGLPTEISMLRQLEELTIKYSSAEHLRSVLESAKGHRLLNCVQIEGFVDDIEMGDYFSDITPFFGLPSLTQLCLWGHPNVKTFPEQLGLLTGITCLGVVLFEDLEEIPECIFNNMSLSVLMLLECKKLKYLPSREFMKRLVYLDIQNCPLLAKRCTKDEGPEWQNISQIGKIKIDDEVIQDFFEG